MNRVRSATLILAFLLAACEGQAPSERLVGEWRFADIRNSQTIVDAQTPPLFDRLEITPPSSIVLHDTLRNKSFSGSYSVEKDVLRWVFQPEDSTTPIEHAVHFSFTDQGGLALRGAAATHSRAQEAEWLFLLPEKFLPATAVSGEWIIPDPENGEGTRWVLLSDGTLGDNVDLWGFYRVWRNSEDELTVTTVVWVQGHGAFVTFQEVVVRGDEMEVTSRIPPGFPPKPTEVWKRAR